MVIARGLFNEHKVELREVALRFYEWVYSLEVEGDNKLPAVDWQKVKLTHFVVGTFEWELKLNITGRPVPEIRRVIQSLQDFARVKPKFPTLPLSALTDADVLTWMAGQFMEYYPQLTLENKAEALRWVQDTLEKNGLHNVEFLFRADGKFIFYRSSHDYDVWGNLTED